MALLPYSYDQALAKIAESNRLLGTGSGDPGAAQGAASGWADWVNSIRAAPTYDDYLEARRQEILASLAEQMASAQIGPAPLPASVQGLLGSQTQNNPFGIQEDPNAYAKKMDAARQMALQQLQSLPTYELAQRAGMDPAQSQAEYDYYHNAPQDEIQQLFGQVQKGAQDYVSKPGLAQLAVSTGLSGILGGVLKPLVGPLLEGIGGPLRTAITSGINAGVSKGAGELLGLGGSPQINTTGNELARAPTTAQTAQTGGVPVNTQQDLAGSTIGDSSGGTQIDTGGQVATNDQAPAPDTSKFPTLQQLLDAERAATPQTASDNPLAGPIVASAAASPGLLADTLSTNTTTDPTQQMDPAAAGILARANKGWGGNVDVQYPYGPLLMEPAWLSGYLKQARKRRYG